MRTNSNTILNPIKMNHSNSFIVGGGEYTGTYNKNNEKIRMLQFDLETTKDTIIKLRAELLNKNKEINNLKINKDDKNSEHLFTLKVIETALKIIGADSSKDSYYESKTENNNISNGNQNGNDNKNDLKEEKEKEKSNNTNNNKLPPIANRMAQSPRREKSNKEISYINSLKQQINGLKELIIKKDEEINEMKKNKTSLNYSNLQNNFEKNFNELTNIKKQNELMKTKIEDVTNLLFIEKEGNKSLKSKLLVFQSSFKEFQEISEKKNTDLETKLVHAQEKERDCKIFHIRKASAPDLMGSRSSSHTNLVNELNDSERLKIAEDEIKNIKKNIESTNKDINNKKDENEELKNNKSELEKKVNELKDRNQKLKKEVNNLNKNVKNLKNNKQNLEKENNNIKSQFDSANSKLTNEQNKITKMKDTLSKKENEINELKKQIEKLKINNNFKNGMFVTSIGTKGKSKNEKIDDSDVNINEELAQIEKKYKMINEEEELNNKKNEEENKTNNNNKEENINNLNDNNEDNKNNDKEKENNVIKEDVKNENKKENDWLID